jgi:hypothetical protein
LSGGLWFGWKDGKVAFLWSAFLGRLALRGMSTRVGVGGIVCITGGHMDGRAVDLR